MFEKDRQNVEEAAKHLKRMLTHFPNDSWKEIENIVDQLQVKTRILNEDCVKHCITFIDVLLRLFGTRNTSFKWPIKHLKMNVKVKKIPTSMDGFTF